MPEKKNALAELAERLVEIAEVFRHEETTRFEDVLNASRIVAELAKVKVAKVNSLKKKEIVEIDYPERDDANIAFLKCRAIAEEGAGNGK